LPRTQEAVHYLERQKEIGSKRVPILIDIGGALVASKLVKAEDHALVRRFAELGNWLRIEEKPRDIPDALDPDQCECIGHTALCQCRSSNLAADCRSQIFVAGRRDRIIKFDI